MRSLPITPLRGPSMPDRFGRVARDLRVSVTDRCNLRCTYCMPAEGLPWMAKPEMLTDEELLRVVGVFVGLGVRQVRLTGGEPLLRRSLPAVVRGIAGMSPRPQIAMTTNGIGLDRLAGPLAEAGLDRVNVSLDTVDPSDFLSLTRRDRFGDVERGLKAAARPGSRRSRSTPWRCGASTTTPSRTCCSGASTAATTCASSSRCRWTPSTPGTRDQMVTRRRGAGTAVRAVHPHADARRGRRGARPPSCSSSTAGRPPSASSPACRAPFCAACDRVRLTADGQVRNCLFARGEVDLRGPLREGASDEELAALIQGEMWRKARGHGIGNPDFHQPDRPMSAIGG